MNGYQLAMSIVASLAWPAVILTAVIILRPKKGKRS